RGRGRREDAGMTKKSGSLGHDRLDYFVDGALAVEFVGERPRHGNSGGAPRCDSFPNQFTGVNQEPSRDAFFESRRLEMANLLAESVQLARHIAIDAGFVRDDLDLFVSGRIIELDRDETLARRMLQVFLDALIPRV